MCIHACIDVCVYMCVYVHCTGIKERTIVKDDCRIDYKINYCHTLDQP